MFRDLLRHSIRALKRHKSYVIINVLGLATGMACSLVILLFVLHEISFDNFHEKGDRIYRVILSGRISGQDLKVTSTAAPIGPTMAAVFPEVESFVRINNWNETIIRDGDNYFTEEHFIEADSSFFDFFSIPLIRGNVKTVLNERYTLVLSATAAARIFGDSDPINRMILVGTDTTRYRITGIFEDIPENSHIQANMIGSFMTNRRANDNHWLSNSFSTYVLLHPEADPETVNARFDQMLVTYVGPELKRYLGVTTEEFMQQGNRYSLFVQPLAKIHLDPSIEQEMKPASDPKYLWIFGSIALLIILIAAINFMNLSTAQAGRRAREIGIKKVAGSSRGMLIAQFLTETIILSLIALLIALLITSLALPSINNLLGTSLTLNLLQHWWYTPSLLLLALLTGLLAGSYPAFYMSAFNPYLVLKGRIRAGRNNLRLRSVLVVLQFSISLILIAGTLIMFRQIHFMIHKDLGFDKNNVMVIRRAQVLGTKGLAFKTALLKIPGVVAVSASTAVPGHGNNNNGYLISGRPDESFLMQTNWVDPDYLSVYGHAIDQGRFFDEAVTTDRRACLLNECAVRKFNISNPLETKIVTDRNEEGEPVLTPVIGVVRDFHFESLRAEIAPHIMMFRTSDFQWGYYSIRYAPAAAASTIEEIEKTWLAFSSGSPMQSFFMDKNVEQMYRAERQNATLAIAFTIMAILIASLGLYGLSSYTVQQRTREIGIRKTFGASAIQIWYLITREILVLLGVALLIAVPLTFLVADNWLNNYYYRIPLSPEVFITGFLITLLVALITVSYRALSAALINPSISLRYE